MIGVLIKGEIWTQKHLEGRPCEETRGGCHVKTRWHGHKPRTPGATRSWKRLGRLLLPLVREGAWLCRQADFWVRASRTMRICFYCLSHSVCGSTWLQQLQATTQSFLVGSVHPGSSHPWESHSPTTSPWPFAELQENSKDYWGDAWLWESCHSQLPEQYGGK